MRAAIAAAAAALVAGAATAPPAQAGALAFCDPPATLDAVQQDRLLRFAAVIKDELDRSGASVALVARAGLDLGRWGQRYSHAGVSLRDSPNGRWSVRQLYFDCDEKRPRLFDQGVAGFVVGAADPGLGHVAVVLPPPAEAAALEAAALDPRRSLNLLGAAYSANAYAFAARYQNCNQWVAELLALAWGRLDAADGPLPAADSVADAAAASPSAAPGDDAPLRAAAQRWLRDAGYEPVAFELGSPVWVWLAGRLPWLNTDDHPDADLAQSRLRVSMPASIESFVRRRSPPARRIEFCHDDARIVVRHGWLPLGPGCTPADGDRIIALD